MRLGTRVWGLGKLLVLFGALGATFLLFFGISVRVALRAQNVDVPPLLGRTVDEATATLTSLGLGVRIDDTRSPDDKVPAGRIVQQDPPAGRQTRRDRMVRIRVSAGPRTTLVPALVGQPERLAQIRLRQDGLGVGVVAEVRSTRYAPDTVVAQDPAPGTRAPGVALLLNRAEPPIAYVMPQLVAMDGARAVEMMQTGGFRTTVVTAAAAPVVAAPPATAPTPPTPPNPLTPATPPGLVAPPATPPASPLTPPPGVVVRQRPPAGYPVSTADLISLEVSQ
jgi:serine/threonine-protein kinase